jgi:hypothetical protein
MYSAIRLLSRKNLNRHGAASNLEGKKSPANFRDIKKYQGKSHV